MENKISVNKTVATEMNHLANNAAGSLSYKPLYSDQNSFKILFHNIWSFHAHVKDIKNQINFTSSDLISISETWTNRTQNMNHYHIPSHKWHQTTTHQTNTRPHRGLITYYKDILSVPQTKQKQPKTKKFSTYNAEHTKEL